MHPQQTVINDLYARLLQLKRALEQSNGVLTCKRRAGGTNMIHLRRTLLMENATYNFEETRCESFGDTECNCGYCGVAG
jgi:hypothetical protein